MHDVVEHRLPFRIFSTPTWWPGGAGDPWVIAFVRGHLDVNGRKTTAVDTLSTSGEHVGGFPVLLASPHVVPPADNVGACSLTNDHSADLIAIDLDGRILIYPPGSSNPRILEADNPVHGLLAWPPVAITVKETGRKALLLVSRRFVAHSNSCNAINLVDAEGRSLPGYPVLLDGIPAHHPALLVHDPDRLFVLLESGQVVSCDVNRPHDISRVMHRVPAAFEGRTCLTFFAPRHALVQSTGAAELVSMGLATGRSEAMLVTSGRRLTRLATAGTCLYAFDELSGELVRIDEHANITCTLAFGLPPNVRSHSLHAMFLPSSGDVVIIAVSCPRPEPTRKIEQAFEQFASVEGRNHIAAWEAAESQRLRAATRPQPGRMARDILMMKKSHLREVLSPEVFTSVLRSSTETWIHVARDRQGQMSVEIADRIPNFIPKTGQMICDVIYPAIQRNLIGGTINFVVPLNEQTDSGRGIHSYRSCVRFYSLRA